MTAPGTALKGVVAALVATLVDALAVPVYNRRPIGNKPDHAYVVVGAGDFDGETNGGYTQDTYAGQTGLGVRARTEVVYVPCLAVYRATSEADAADGALDLLDEAATAIVAKPKLGLSYAYDALVARVDQTRIIPVKTGRLCVVVFAVQVHARLV